MAFNCTLCERLFNQRSTLVDHYLTHSFGDDLFRCPRCFYACDSLDLLLQHAAARHPTAIPCPLCPFNAETRKELLLHRKRHRLDQIFRCEICQYSSRYRGTLNRHMKVHSDERPFACTVCNFRAKLKTTLTNHIYAKHVDLKDFDCDWCEKSFVTNQNLQTHILTHTGERPHPCEQCNRRFRQKQHLDNHCRRKHY